MFHFLRTAAAVPNCKVADCTYNGEEILKLIIQAKEADADIVVFPELCITAYSCADLFMQSALMAAAEDVLCSILMETKEVDMLLAVGLPVAADNQLFNCCAIAYRGILLGIVPKTYLPNYSEFYEERWFSSAQDLISKEVLLCGQTVPIGGDLLFFDRKRPYFTFGVEICEDLWAPIPPSSYLCLQGAILILNGSASNEVASKHSYRRELVKQQSSRSVAAYVYTSAGTGESTQDTVFGGYALICENGSILQQSKRFLREGQLILADIDLEALANDRKKNSSFMAHTKGVAPYAQYRKIGFDKGSSASQICLRHVAKQPFVPQRKECLEERCAEIFQIQVTGLAKRMLHTGIKTLVLGISGGLDSTLALLVAVKACDYLELNHSAICGITMPGFGTTDRTYQNALHLMQTLGVTIREISIRDCVTQHFIDIGHDSQVHDVTYENSQARERTQILMDVANQVNGLVVGTGDLSELALGFATYNGDHMSMYGVNAGVPKTLVRVLVGWVAEFGNLDAQSKKTLEDVLDTPVSPELLPPDKEGKIKQKTEEIVGPYELHDFFLYYVVRFGFSPSKIFFLAQRAFQDSYDKKTLLKWLKNFYRRFFSQQFKRSCLPDGPKVGTICLSPRADWKMPSDACARLWLEEIEAIEETECPSM